MIKPNEPRFLRSGSRVIIKKKNPKFLEVEKKPKKKEPIDPEVQQHLDLIDQLITENRLKNVLSHIGKVTQKDFGVLMGQFTQDVMLDYKKDNDLEIEKDKSKSLNKKVSGRCAELIRKHFVNIIDGTF